MRIDHNREAFAESFLPGPNQIGHCLVDDRHLLGVLAVEIREIPATQCGDMQRREIAGHDVIEDDERASVVGIGLLAFSKYGSRNASIAASQNAVGGYRRIRNARNRFDSFEGFAEELLAVFRLIAERAEIYVVLEKICRLEADIDCLGSLHASQKKSRANQSNQR